MDPEIKALKIAALQGAFEYIALHDNDFSKQVIELRSFLYVITMSRIIYEEFRDGKRKISDIFDIKADFVDIEFIIKVDVTDYLEYNCNIDFAANVKILADKFYAKIISPNSDESMSRCNAEIFRYGNCVLKDIISEKIYMPNIQRMQVYNCKVDIDNNEVTLIIGYDSIRRSLATMSNLFVIENTSFIKNKLINNVTIIPRSNIVVNINNFVYGSVTMHGDVAIYTNLPDVVHKHSIAQIEQVELMCKNANK
jgi:hypothetical protein